MGVKDKATYGEYYWAMQVEAQAEFDEQLEDAISPYIRGLFADIPEISELPVGMQTFINSLAEPPSAGFGDLIKVTGGELGAELLKDAIAPAMTIMKRVQKRRTRETWLTSEQVNTLFRQGKITEDLWELVIASEGYEDVLGKFLYESQAPFPSIPDLITYSRYHGDPYNPWSEAQKWFDIPARDYPLWKWLGLQRLTTLQVQTLYRRGQITQTELVNELAKIGWDAGDSIYIEQLGWTIPNAMLLVQGNLHQGQSQSRILNDISIADINPKYAQTYLDAILTKPSSQDIIAFELRKDPSLSGLDLQLRKIGIHPDYNSLYKTLAYPIPPVADIITMAVREAFTPEIAERFGQYEDYPPEFELWAERKGLSKDWSQRYWAAHWSLPSASQGFEMLHRGVITTVELNMLLRALDVMPFWRDRLTRIAYRRLSRVDIRRMYRVGVLTEAEVYEAYLELGYNERDAKRMSDFTLKQVLATQAKFTSRDIVSAYTKYMLTRSDARMLLIEIGVRSENISFILTSADYKRAWALTEDRIAAIRNMYKKEVYGDNKARAELLRLNLPAEQVEVLMSQWYIDEKDKPPRRWTTAQSLTFAKAELITLDRAKQELTAIGYDTEHIDIYMESIK